MSLSHPIWPLSEYQPWLHALRTGGIAAAPAEGVYGYVAHAFDESALLKLALAKQRSISKGYIVLIKNTSQLELLCPNLPASCADAISTYWQAGQPATTLILPALSNVPELLTGGKGTVAVRLPQSDYMQEYLEVAAIPLVSTSLNISGQPPALDAASLPTDIPALTLPHVLSGAPSRIFAPLDGTWLR